MSPIELAHVAKPRRRFRGSGVRKLHALLAVTQARDVGAAEMPVTSPPEPAEETGEVTDSVGAGVAPRSWGGARKSPVNL